MKKFAMFAGAALIAISGIAAAQPGPGPRGPAAEITRDEALQRADAMFARLDLDRDGRVTEAEARQAHRQRREERLERRFERADLDGNGAVTLAEMRQARERMRERFAERRAEHGQGAGMRRPMHGRHRGGHGGGAMLGRLLGPDGTITAAEFRAHAAERFERLDRDDDGTVTLTERRAARAEMRERHRPRR